MATLKDLQDVRKTPRTHAEWFAKFDKEDQDIIRKTLTSGGSIQDAYRVLRELEENPYPFNKFSIYTLAEKLLSGEL